jgi:nitrous oxidase accessory protein NosD
MRIATRLALLAAVLTFATPVQAATFSSSAWVSGSGDDNNQINGCVRTAPCQTLTSALQAVLPGGTISCVDPTLTSALIISKDVSIDCSGGVVIAGISDGIVIDTAGVEVTLRGLVIIGLAIDNTQVQAGIDIAAAALVRVENCKISGFSQAGIKAEPSANNLTVKIQDSTIMTNGSGVLVAPTGGGSVSMSIDRSRIENNSGGGVKTDTSSGAISASISDSSISFNNGNGLNAVSISGAQNMLTLVRDVITKNGTAGIQANGASAAALVNNTLLDTNVAGATSAVGGGRILTYGNNSTIGPAGSGFTGTAPLN